MSAQIASEAQRKACAFDDKMAAQASNARAERRKIALASIARAGGAEGAEAKRILAAEAAADTRKAEADELDALPKSINTTGSNARAYAKADMRRRIAAKEGSGSSSAGRESMAKMLRARGVEPAIR